MSGTTELVDKNIEICIKYIEEKIGKALPENIKAILIFFVKNGKEFTVFAINYKEKGAEEAGKVVLSFLRNKGIITGELVATLTNSEGGKCLAAVASLLTGFESELAILEISSGLAASGIGIAPGALGAIAALGLLLMDVLDVGEKCEGYLTHHGGTQVVRSNILGNYNSSFKLNNTISCLK